MIEYHGTITGRLSRSHPEMQELPGHATRRRAAMVQALAIAYGAHPSEFPQEDIYKTLVEKFGER